MNDGDYAVHAYRPVRPGDLIAVRATDPHLDEAHVLIESVYDNGKFLLLTGAWRGCDLEVRIQRIGDTQPLQLLEN